MEWERNENLYIYSHKHGYIVYKGRGGLKKYKEKKEEEKIIYRAEMGNFREEAEWEFYIVGGRGKKI